MAASIGSLVLNFPLKWIDKGAPVTLGSEVRTRSGDLVIVRLNSVSQRSRLAHLRFEWEPWSSVAILQNMWKSGRRFSMNPEDTGQSYMVIFLAKNGVRNVRHQAWGDDVVKAALNGFGTDLYTGELNVVILTG